MALFKNEKCFFYSKEINDGFKGKEFECTVVCQSGSVAFVIYEIGLQYLVEENILRKALLHNKSIEAEGVYIRAIDEDVLPLKCKIKIEAMAGVTNFNILNINSFVGMKNEDLKKILDIE